MAMAKRQRLSQPALIPKTPWGKSGAALKAQAAPNFVTRGSGIIVGVIESQ
jgi:hypothetical protein